MQKSNNEKSLNVTNPQAKELKMRYFVFCDGTGQNLSSKNKSNVAKIFLSAKGEDIKPSNGFSRAKKHEQNIFVYQNGIGADKIEFPSWGWVLEKFHLLSGAEIQDKVSEIIEYLLSVLNEDDEVIFVGFSRGASTCRMVSSLLLEKLPKAKIQYMLLFDTVYSVFVPIEVKGFGKRKYFKDLSINSSIPFVDHLISCDEMREKFPLTPVNKREGVNQIAFAGAHSDVGGGLPSTELSDIALEYSFEALINHFGDDLFKVQSFSPNPVGQIGWDSLGGTGQKHFPRDFKDLDFAVHESVEQRTERGGSIPIALAQLQPYCKTNF